MLNASLPSSIEFHNVAAAEPSANGTGWLLSRFPRAAYETFESPGFLTAQEASGVELRFVSDARHLRVFLSPVDRITEVVIFKGDFQHAVHTLAPGVIHCLQLTPPDHLATIKPGALMRSFHPDVWRVVFGNGSMVFHGIDSFGRPVRPPSPAEKPAIRWLAYGSSITHSSRHGYPMIAARRLGIDVQNKGQSGSCYIEPAAAEFIAAGCEWDIATLELGINLRGTHSVEDFERRVRHLVARCLEAKPGRPIALITLFQNAADQLIAPDERTTKQDAFKAILRGVANENRGRNVHLIEGGDIVTDLGFLGSDLLHPTDYGHARMGENLARLLQPLIPGGTSNV
jgi:hypothetical protein